MKWCRTCDAMRALLKRHVECSWCRRGEAPWVAERPPEVERAFAARAAKDAGRRVA